MKDMKLYLVSEMDPGPLDIVFNGTQKVLGWGVYFRMSLEDALRDVKDLKGRRCITEYVMPNIVDNMIYMFVQCTGIIDWGRVKVKDEYATESDGFDVVIAQTLLDEEYLVVYNQETLNKLTEGSVEVYYNGITKYNRVL